MKIKKIGCYWYPESWADYDAGPGKWHTDVSALVVPKVAVQSMLTGMDPNFLLRLHNDPFDFMLRQKVQGQQKCYIGDVQTQKTARYYVSKLGQPMRVIRPAPGPIGWYKRKNKITDALYNQVIAELGGNGLTWDARIHTGKEPKPGKEDERGRYEDTVSAIVKGYKVRDCCDADQFNFGDVDYDFYLDEINKIIIKE